MRFLSASPGQKILPTMSKVLHIAWTEYLNAVRSKAFIMGVIMLPVFMFGGLALQHLVKDKVDLREKRFAVIDKTGRFFPMIQAEAARRNEKDIFFPAETMRGRQIRPAFIPEERKISVDETTLMLELSEAVRAKQLFAFLMIDAGVLAPEERGASLSYFTETPTFTELPSWLEQTLNEKIKSLRLIQAGMDPALIGKVTQPVPMKKLGLMKKDAAGKVLNPKTENTAARFAVPVMSMMLLFMMIMSSAPTLLNGVLEEKMNKIAEVLISSVSPFHLMLGKLAGAILTSFTLSLLYLGAIAFTLFHFGVSEFVPVTHYLWFLLFQLLALMMYGSMFSALGAACSEIRDAQSIMMPAMLLLMLPLFVWLPVIQSPSSNFARTLSLLPPLTPLLMMLRIFVPPGPPWWEILAGVILTFLFMLICVWASSRIFRVGMLFQGQPPSFRRLFGWLWVK